LSLAGATALFGVCPNALADEAPETRTIRFARNASICVFPQFYLQETLRAEGFSEIGYIESSAVRTLEPIARGTADFAVSFGLGQILEIDAGSPITILGGVHVGCYELFARESIRSVPELKGKSVGLETASPVLLKLMAANVGLDPEKDFNWVTDRKLKPLELFAAGKIDAFLGFPPEPQELHERRVGHVVLSTTADRPWSDYYCCMLAGNAERFWALPATVGGEAVLGVTVRRFGDHTGPRIEDERCAIGPRPVGGKERIKRLPCHALDRDFQIDRRCLGLFIKSDHATASEIGEGAHATAASFAGNCQFHEEFVRRGCRFPADFRRVFVLAGRARGRAAQLLAGLTHRGARLIDDAGPT